MAVWKPTNAFFTDTAISEANTFTTSEAFPSADPTPTDGAEEPLEESENIADHIVISEVQIGSAASTTHDFIELYNPTDSPISLDDHRLVRRTSAAVADTSIKSFGSNDIVPAKGYYLWTSNDLASIISADASTSSTLSENTSIALRHGPVDTGDIIDALAWGTFTGSPLVEGTVFPSNPSTGQSLERKAISTSTESSMTSGSDATRGNGYDSNNNANDFILRTTSQPQNSTSGQEQL